MVNCYLQWLFGLQSCRKTNKSLLLHTHRYQDNITAFGSEEKKTSHPQDAVSSVATFEEMNLSEDLLRGIFAYGYEKPSVIQQKAIVPLINGSDLIAQSQSGTGKTGAFGIGVLQSVNGSKNRVQALVMEPSRDLALQNASVLSALASYTEVKVRAFVGGSSTADDLAALRSGVHVVVGTPGRVLDLLEKGVLSLEFLKHLVLDEADEMLSQGFLDAMKNIIGRLPKGAHISVFSATMPPETLEITDCFMQDPIRITLARAEVTLKGIPQYYIDVHREEYKLDTLCDIFDSISLDQCVIFVNTRRRAEILTKELTDRDFGVSCMHSDLTSEERKEVMGRFRIGRTRVLIATDIIARGIDVQGVSVVVNYDMTKNFENYIHRIGRSGRLGRKGSAINFVTSYEFPLLKQLVAYYETDIAELPKDFVEQANTKSG